MEKHGSESYFVVGEGLVGESGEGRQATMAATTAGTAQAAPPFRFSRMGLKGINRQLGDANLKKNGAAMAAGGGGVSQIPAGFTYLGQPARSISSSCSRRPAATSAASSGCRATGSLGLGAAP